MRGTKTDRDAVRCSRCGRCKSVGAILCLACRRQLDAIAEEQHATLAFNSKQSQKMLNERLTKPIDRFTLAFNRWRRMRRRYVMKLQGGLHTGPAACSCGAPKRHAAKLCDVCRDAWTILRHRIPIPVEPNQPEGKTFTRRLPRIARLVEPAPRECELGTGNGWDDILRIVERDR